MTSKVKETGSCQTWKQERQDRVLGWLISGKLEPSKVAQERIGCTSDVEGLANAPPISHAQHSLRNPPKHQTARVDGDPKSKKCACLKCSPIPRPNQICHCAKCNPPTQTKWIVDQVKFKSFKLDEGFIYNHLPSRKLHKEV